MDAETRPSLLVRLRDPRDAGAWEQFVAAYGPLVYRSARRRGLSHADAEDVTQRVFARVLGGIRGFDYDRRRGRFRDWLRTVVRNEVFRYLGQERGDSVLTALPDDTAAPADDPDWAGDFAASVLAAALERCRPHFEADTWSAFEAVWRHDRPAAVVAAELGRPVTWVYVAKSRALGQLWDVIRELTDDGVWQ